MPGFTVVPSKRFEDDFRDPLGGGLIQGDPAWAISPCASLI